MSTEIDKKLDKITLMLEQITEERKIINETWEEFSPIMKLVLNSGGQRLQQWEERGYFDFLKGVGVILDEVMSNYTPEDLEKLSKSVVGILDTIRSLTQDDILQIANEAAEAIHEADKTKPVGIRGLVKASRDEDVRRGMGMMMELLRHVGKGAKDIKRSGARPIPRFQESADPKQQKLAKLLAPKRRGTAVSSSVKKKVNPVVKKVKSLSVEGIELDSEGFFVNPESWSKELAEKMAMGLGYEKLTDEQWVLINFARSEYMETKSAPNMRKLSVGSGVPTKSIFKLFPSSPAKVIAKIAGITKPVGCI